MRIIYNELFLNKDKHEVKGCFYFYLSFKKCPFYVALNDKQLKHYLNCTIKKDGIIKINYETFFIK